MRRPQNVSEALHVDFVLTINYTTASVHLPTSEIGTANSHGEPLNSSNPGAAPKSYAHL